MSQNKPFLRPYPYGLSFCILETMQSIVKQKNKPKINFKSFSVEEKQRLVGAFAWLIEQDKKQNPALYQLNNKKND